MMHTKRYVPALENDIQTILKYDYKRWSHYNGYRNTSIIVILFEIIYYLISFSICCVSIFISFMFSITYSVNWTKYEFFQINSYINLQFKIHTKLTYLLSTYILTAIPPDWNLNLNELIKSEHTYKDTTLLYTWAGLPGSVIENCLIRFQISAFFSNI